MAPRGRPRSFDREKALERLMEVFWSKGYEGTQVSDLTAALNIGPPSFYAAFGSKEAAFLEAVDLYIATVGAGPMRALAEAPTAREGIRAMLRGSIDVALTAKPGGCMLILGAAHGGPARNCLMAARRETVEHIRARLRRGIAEGELPAGPDLAAFYHGVMQAISHQARDGATRPELEALIEPAMAALA
ncbi:TetR/AcrR family transcriptional regulator [Paenirhodobacter sp.]|uniref:TetR/AcrR family transcriptional regulator n=1 Tax=Paenirhodobacter sp. TaxID=1965326 RepID=UPI003B3F4AD3